MLFAITLSAQNKKVSDYVDDGDTVTVIDADLWFRVADLSGSPETQAVQLVDKVLLASNAVDFDTIFHALDDTSLIASYVIGLGNAGDTIAFSLGDNIAAMKWDGSHNLVLTQVTGVVDAGDIDIALWHDANYLDGTPTEVLSGDLTITSTTAGDDATGFASATIAPNVWLWITVEQQTTQPTQCIVNLYGYLTEL